MTYSQWPSTITQSLMQDGFTEDMEDNVISFSPEVGDPIERRRASRTDTTMVFKGMYTRAEWPLLQEYIRDTRPRRFIRRHPFDDADGAFKFISSAKITKLYRNNCEVQYTVRYYGVVDPLASSGYHSASSPALASLAEEA